MQNFDQAPVPADIQEQVTALNNNINIQALTSTEGIKTIALNDTRCPANSVRWFNCRLSLTSELPSASQVTSIARVTKRINGTCFIELFTDSGETWTISYDGVSWHGWQQLALNNKKARAFFSDSGVITFDENYGTYLVFGGRVTVAGSYIILLIRLYNGAIQDTIELHKADAAYSVSGKTLTITRSSSTSGMYVAAVGM